MLLQYIQSKLMIKIWNRWMKSMNQRITMTTNENMLETMMTEREHEITTNKLKVHENLN